MKVENTVTTNDVINLLLHLFLIFYCFSAKRENSYLTPKMVVRPSVLIRELLYLFTYSERLREHRLSVKPGAEDSAERGGNTWDAGLKTLTSIQETARSNGPAVRLCAVCRQNHQTPELLCKHFLDYVPFLDPTLSVVGEPGHRGGGFRGKADCSF